MIGPVCVCAPARNEAGHIATLIGALAAQRVDKPFVLALCVNNSHDGTARVALKAASRADERMTMALVERRFEDGLAHAGSARRAAMDLGAVVLGCDNGLLISTDADCRPPPDWIATNLAASARDHIVGGRIALDDADAPQASEIFALRRRFDAYWRMVRAIEDSIDPVPWDPPPRHGDHTGASLALTVGLYRKAGGVPLVASGEDRALVDAAIAAGGKLLHPETVWTRASARVRGRATGGMAEELARWSDAAAREHPLLVPDYAHWRERAVWRRTQRKAGSEAQLRAAEERLPPLPRDMALPKVSCP